MGNESRRLDQMLNDVNEGAAISSEMIYDPKDWSIRVRRPDDDPDTVRPLSPKDATLG